MNEVKLSKNEISKNEKGASLVEYALLVALIAIVCIIGLNAVSSGVNTKFSQVERALAT